MFAPINTPELQKKAQRALKLVGVFASFLFVNWKGCESDAARIACQGQKDLLDQVIQLKNDQLDSVKAINYGLDGRVKGILSKVVNDSRDLDDLPFPVWIKLFDPLTQSFKRVYFNRAYERRYDINRITTLGRDDADEVSAEVAQSWNASDWAAYRSRDPIAADDLSPSGGLVPVVKWRIDRGAMTYIYGMDLSE